MNPTHTASGKPVPPVVLSGKDMYDSLMKNIEPDLVSDMLPRLSQKYMSETPAQKKQRAQRYNNAFAEYERRFASYKQEWENQLRGYQRAAIMYVEHKEKGNESSALQEIESSLSAE